MNEKLEALIKRLESIARKNGDSFSYSIDIRVSLGKKSLRYSFVALENPDGHAFVIGDGLTLLDAILAANDSIPDALENWGYRE